MKTSYDVTEYRGNSDVMPGFYLSILGDNIFHTLECINYSYYTILVGPVVQMNMSFHIMLLQYPGEYIFMILVISDPNSNCGEALTQILAKTLNSRNLDHS